MNGLDYLIICIVTVSALIGVWRGFVKEAVSLAVWAGSFLLAYGAAGQLEGLLESLIDDRSLRVALVFVVVFLLIHVIGYFASRVLHKAVKTVGLRSVDRVAGAGFGVIRGVVVVAAPLLLIGMTSLVSEPFWQESYMVEVFNRLMAWVSENHPALVERVVAPTV